MARWTKGQSGNRKGRPKSGIAIAELARGQVARHKLIEKLGRIGARLGEYIKVDVDQQMRAIQLLLAYGYGPPRAEVNVSEGVVIQVVYAETNHVAVTSAAPGAVADSPPQRTSAGRSDHGARAGGAGGGTHGPHQCGSRTDEILWRTAAQLRNQSNGARRGRIAQPRSSDRAGSVAGTGGGNNRTDPRVRPDARTVGQGAIPGSGSANPGPRRGNTDCSDVRADRGRSTSIPSEPGRKLLCGIAAETQAVWADPAKEIATVRGYTDTESWNKPGGGYSCTVGGALAQDLAQDHHRQPPGLVRSARGCGRGTGREPCGFRFHAAFAPLRTPVIHKCPPHSAGQQESPQ
jgi:hypothetical protein